MSSNYWRRWSETYREELLGNIMPFWMKFGLDREHGGVFTCLDRDGTLMDPTKSVWFQGRFGWMAASVYSDLRKRPSFLAASKSCCEFLAEHCFDRDGRAFFEVTREGVGLRKRRYVFSECFAAMAYAAYARASGESEWADRAVGLFKRIRRFAANPDKWMPSKYTPAFAAQGHSLTMILINVANEIKRISDDRALDRQITESVEKIVRYFLHPEFKALLETVGPNGEFIDTLVGRTINPGHAIETSWFLLDVAVARGDEALQEIALKILDWSWEWGWDEQYGGIVSFRDCRNFPAQSYEQDMKFWWPQCEAIIASAYAYALTGDKRYRRMHELANTWAWEHLRDREYPEWYGYLHRDGTVAQSAKGNIFKGPFHIPRMLLKTGQLIDTYLA